MNTSYPLERWMVWIVRSIVPLSATTILALASSSVFPPGMATTANLAAASVATVPVGMDDYQPPNNGGPGKTGGSGTRWH